MITIRKMTEADTTEVLAMMRVFYDSPAVIHTASDEILQKDIADCVSDMPFLEGFVFEADGQVAGYAMITCCYTTEYGGICVWVEDLYLKPDYRRMGISTQFFQFIEEKYPQAVRFKLEVEQENEHAIASYRKNGYGISPYFEMTREIPQEES